MKAGLTTLVVAAVLLVAWAPGAAADDPYDPYGVAPQTVIDSGPPPVSRSARPTFTFSSPDPFVTFECALTGSDPEGFSPCASPFLPAPLSQGTYTFRVRAVNLADLRDPTPAALSFDIDRNLSGANASAARVQPVRGRSVSLAVAVKASEPVRVFAAGRVRLDKRHSYALRSPEASIEAGVRRRLILTPEKAKASRRIRKALKRKRGIEAVLAATFSDAVGNRATTGEIDVELRRR